MPKIIRRLIAVFAFICSITYLSYSLIGNYLNCNKPIIDLFFGRLLNTTHGGSCVTLSNQERLFITDIDLSDVRGYYRLYKPSSYLGAFDNYEISSSVAPLEEFVNKCVRVAGSFTDQAQHVGTNEVTVQIKTIKVCDD